MFRRTFRLLRLLLLLRPSMHANNVVTEIAYPSPKNLYCTAPHHEARIAGRHRARGTAHAAAAAIMPFMG